MANDRHGLGQADLEVDSAKHLGRREACAGADAKALPDGAEFEGERHADR